MAKIALIDSGIDTQHFKANLIGGISVETGPHGVSTAGEDPNDNCGHGSACASAILKESPQSKIFAVRIFNERLVTDYGSLRFALEYLSDVDVDIINLSLALDTEKEKYREIMELTRKLHKQGKEIFWAIKNGRPENRLFTDRSFWSVGTDDSLKSLYIDEKNSFIRVNSLPYLHYKLNGSYELFGSSTSYATAKAAGIMANYIDTRRDRDNAVADLISDHNEPVGFEPLPYKDDTIEYDTELFYDLMEIIKAYFGIYDDETVLGYSLFSSRISGHSDFCFDLIKIIESALGISFEPYTELSKLDFVSVYSLYKLTYDRIKIKERRDEKIS